MNLDLDQMERMRRPGRKIQGISAVLLPYEKNGRMDEAGFLRHLQRTLDAGLRPAVNMDTGYGDLLTPGEKRQVLDWTEQVTVGRDGFIAGALPQEKTTISYARECEAIRKRGGVPIIFPSEYTAQLDDEGLRRFFYEIAQAAECFMAFELGSMFNPNGRMFSVPVLQNLLETPQCVGLKHSSLNRQTEIQRIQLRDRLRPDFSIFSGNDLAADMVEYGSDYLLGLSTLAPELFATRDRAWEEGKAEYFELRDMIQYLGWVTFRDPVPAYKHSAAIFLKLTGGLKSDEPHPRAPRRESWDRQLLADAARRMQQFCPQGTRP